MMIHLFLSRASWMLSIIGLWSLDSRLSIKLISSLNTVTTFQLYLALHSTYPLFHCFFTMLTISLRRSSLPGRTAGFEDVQPSSAPTVRSCLLPTTSMGTLETLRLSHICSLRVFTYWNVSRLDKSKTRM